MLSTRKTGPPVPPRPSAAAVAHALSKNREKSPPQPQVGRTVIYKSPSFDQNKRLNAINNNDENINNSHESSHKHSFISENKANGLDKHNIEMKKTDVVFVGDINSNHNGMLVLEDKTNELEPKKYSPIATPRRHIERNNLIDSNKKYTSTCNIIEITSSSASTSSSSSPSSTLSKEPKIINPNFNIHGDDCEILTSNQKSMNSYNDDNINNDIIIINSPVGKNTAGKNTNTTAISTPPPPTIAKKKNELEIENNLRNLVNKNLFTEIFINSKTPLVEAKNQELHKINMNNKSILRTSSVKLPYRPEPEGGEHKPGHDKMCEKKVEFHELLISELTAMRKEDQTISKRQRYPSERRSNDVSPYGTTRSRISTSDWIEVGDNGKEVMLTSCQISLEDSGMEDGEKLDDASSGVGDSWDSVKDAEERINMSLPGLPPLPKSLSGFDITGTQMQHNNNNNTAASLAALEAQRGMSPMTRKPATLDTQLAVLRREMYGLRQLDLSLLSQLWALNESIQDFRTILQEQETLSPPSPTPSNSDVNSVTSDDEDDDSSNAIEAAIAASRMRAPPPPPPNRKAPSRPV